MKMWTISSIIYVVFTSSLSLPKAMKNNKNN